MSERTLKSAPLAYKNEPYLNSTDGRLLRILTEYKEPLSRFRREQIQDTVVFFGSARFHGMETARKNLAALEQAHLSAEQKVTNRSAPWLRWTRLATTKTPAPWLAS